MAHVPPECVGSDAQDVGVAKRRPGASSQEAELESPKCGERSPQTVVKLFNGRAGTGGTAEIPLIMNFEGRPEHLVIWRNRQHWVAKQANHGTSGEAWPPPSAAVSQMTGETLNRMRQQRLREKQTAMSSRSTDRRLIDDLEAEDLDEIPDEELPPRAGCSERVRLAATRQRKAVAKRRARHWQPAGNKEAFGDKDTNWGSWGAPWGQQPRSLSHPSLRGDGRGAEGARDTEVQKKLASRTLRNERREFLRTGKELGFVARAMLEKPVEKTGSSLESIIEDRRKAVSGEAVGSVLGRCPPSTKHLLAGKPPTPRVLSTRPFAGLSLDQLTNHTVDAIRLPELKPGEMPTL